MRKLLLPLPQNYFCWLSKNHYGGIFKKIIAVAVLSFFVSAVSAQKEKVTITASSTIKQVITEIEKQTNYLFVYDKNEVNLDTPVKISVKNKPADEVLDAILANTNISYAVRGNNIMLMKNKVSNNNSSTTSNVIKGKVLDAEGLPVIGAIVKVKSTGEATITNENGDFTLSGIPDNSKLIISSIGYSPVEIDANDKGLSNITMQEENKALDEVIVVGYGMQKKVNLTGAVAAVGGKSLADKPVTSLTNSLQGMVQGLTIINRPEDVGKDIGTINIRGRGNLGASSPLFVVDGIPVTAEDFARINPKDVDNISVLKDASAAIYGSRAAFGVILVTTKKGTQKEGMDVGLNVSYGGQKALYLPNYLGAYDYANLLNEAAKNAGHDAIYSAEALKKIQAGNDLDNYPDNNWYKMVLRPTAPILNTELSISGGGKTRYYLSGGLMKQSSLLPLKGLSRYSFRSNIESELSKILTLTSNVSFIRDEIKNDGGELDWRTINRILPLTVNKQSNGDWGTITGGQINSTQAVGNPYRKIHAGGWGKDATNRFIGTIGGILHPTKEWEVNTSFTYNFSSRTEALFNNYLPELINFQTPTVTIPGTGQQCSLKETYYNTSLALFQIYSSYEKSVGKHFAKIMLGTSYEANAKGWLQAYRTDFPSNSLSSINAGAQNKDLNNGGNKEQRTFISGFGRFNYSYDEKYLLEAMLRADGSSQFPPLHRWGYFPSVALGWIISNESFMQNIKWIDVLKLRTSWGRLGYSNNVGAYDYLDVLNTGTSAILGNNFVNGVWPNQVANNSLTWEVVDSKNIGLDANLLKSRIILQLDIFSKRTEGILLQLPHSSEFGYTKDTWTNAGKLSNKGIELQLTYQDRIGDFDYSITGNMSKIWNKVLDLHGQNNQIIDSWIFREGSPVGSFYMYKSLGLYKDDKEAESLPHFAGAKGGDIKYADLSGPDGKPDGKIDAYDRTIVGNDVPYFNYGLNLSLRYKGFDFSAFGQGVSGVKVYISAEGSQAFFNGAGIKKYSLDRWTPTNQNPNAAYPRLLPSTDNAINLFASDFWLFNANYFRVKTLTLGYTIPAETLKGIGVKKCRVYFSSNNLLTIRGDKRMKDFDPESPTSVGNFYPATKTFVGGLTLNF